MKRRALLALPALLSLPLRAQPNRTPSAAPLTAADRAEIARLESHLDSIRSLSARFVQVDARGGYASGRLWLSRPGRMRFEYDPPTPILLVADGSFVIFHDRSVMQTSHIPISATPLALLLAERIRLDSGEAETVRLNRAEGLIQATVIRRGRAQEGSLTLTFSDPPLALRQWVVVDAQGQSVRVSLFDVELGGRFDPALFRFVDPRFFQNAPGSN